MNKSVTLKRLFNEYTKKYISKIGIAVFFSVLVAASTSSIAWLLDPAIEKIFIQKNETLLIVIPFLIIIAFTTKGVSLYLARIIMINVGEDIKKKLQFDMLNTLISADTRSIDEKHTGKFISNLTYDVMHITNLLSNGILNLFKDSLTLIGLLVVMFLQNWKLSLIAIILIPIASTAARSLGKRMGKVTTEAQEKSSFLTKYLVELFKNHKLTKIFQKEKYETNRADNYLNQLKEKNKKIGHVIVRISPVMEVLTGLMIAILIFYSGKLIAIGELSVNNFFSFLAAMMLAYQPVRSLSTLNVILNQGLSAAARILSVVDTEKFIKNQENAKEINLGKAGIKFEDVIFSYNENEGEVLKNINLEFQGGKMTSLVGHSGSGKSTILNLIPRFYDCISGDILIDDQSIYNVTLHSLRRNISLVSQETTLFDDTIKNNIKYANLDASEEEIFNAAKLSHCDEFIRNLPEKYETIIGEDGVRLSGGEKQRISIARAMLKKSSIILLDEATSSLDSETETKIQDALKILTKDKTTIVIAHRLSTILNSNRIYVIDSGKIIDNGKHEDLLINSKIYKNFHDKQFQR
ncbi:ABC transporter ATP-binding protein/permease [Candidatus Pelagibacter sp.]|nr:ABC transporter ATP-binding protein/permease [Candidatus Pelagibacter sp.]